MQGKFLKNIIFRTFSKSELLCKNVFLSKRVFGWIVGVSTFLMMTGDSQSDKESGSSGKSSIS